MPRTTALALVAVLLATPSVAAPPPAPSAEPGARSEAAAVRIVRRMEKAMGGRAAWNRTRYLQWSFFGRRHHWWDRRTGDVRIEASGSVTLLNLNTREGRSFRDGTPVEGESLGSALEEGYAAWVNDSWWLIMPWKLRDEGVVLAHAGVREMEGGRPADVIRVSFHDVGLTPQNVYEVWIDQATHLVAQWSFFPTKSEPSPKFTREFSGFERVGRVLIATRRGGDEDWRIAAPAELPRSVFTDEAPLTPPVGTLDRPAR